MPLKPAEVRFYVDADILGLAHVLAAGGRRVPRHRPQLARPRRRRRPAAEIEAEHPAFADALHAREESLIAGEPMNPRLHIAMHEIVTNQLWADDEPEVWTTVQRLTQLGYDRHVVLHMIASSAKTFGKP